MMRLRHLLLPLCGLALGLIPGCDSSLVDGSYLGEPLLVVTGSVRLVDKDQAAPSPFPAGTLRLALMWLGPKDAAADTLFMAAVEQSVSLVAVFPARYQVAIHTPPPDAAILTDTGAGAYALAVLAAYVDTNDNGAFDRDIDKLVGGATGQRVIGYFPNGLQASWLPQPISAGYHRMVVQGVGQACKNPGRVPLVLDPEADTEVKVFAQMPTTLFPDLNCDGTHSEFTAGCPSPYKVSTDCAKGKADPFICANCPGL